MPRQVQERANPPLFFSFENIMKKLYEEKIRPFIYLDGTCWFIQNYSKDAYARIWQKPPGQKGFQLQAHRISYIVHKGTIPEGMLLMHSCNRKGCVNPEHLSPGTNQQNQLDASRDGLHPLGGVGIRGVSSTFRYGHLIYKAVTSGRPRQVLYYGKSLEEAVAARKAWENR